MRRPSRTRSALVALTALMLALTGCTGLAHDPVREPHPVDEPLPAVDVGALRLPTPSTGLSVVDPGWSTDPRYADGVFLAPSAREDLLRFTAVDVRGDVLWAAERPGEGSGFAVSTDDDGRSLAILTDVHDTPGEHPEGRTATAYDLITGEHAWGPVQVPGPLDGPGLVFTARSAEPTRVDAARTVLDPSTGRVLTAESGTSGQRIVGEYHGTVLLTDDHTLTALDAGDRRQLWQVPVPDRRRIEAAADTPRPAATAPGLALLQAEHSPGLLIDLRDGAVLSDTAREAAVDPGTGTVVVLDESGLHSSRGGQELWSVTVPEDTSIAALGGALLYLRSGGAVRVHNALTGEVAEAYDPDGAGTILVPVFITAEGAALFSDGQRRLLATVVPERDPGQTG